ncbi:Sel1 repeat-containing protein [Toxoplasma gondii GT1]|uniref:Sel1 repeat-containing protein n=3 Tax=Toxoplasma gondii TaxID=5811 RepID=S7UYC7_TOXGG|nr:Sel1 repeat-containing protein [Toxoplasma gondii GT1]KFH15260.1 Sel1 repeat-containing protein [Toxoplasma gondii MAS]PIM05298.1 Sel1 repeat-containing protein [Toxoplasma gondii COUG]
MSSQFGFGGPLFRLKQALVNFQAFVDGSSLRQRSKATLKEECVSLQRILEGCLQARVPQDADLNSAAEQVVVHLAEVMETIKQITQQAKKESRWCSAVRGLEERMRARRRLKCLPLALCRVLFKFTGVLIGTLTAVQQQNTLDMAAARLECAKLRRELSKDDDLEKKECASRLCIEGHKNRFGYGVPTNLLRAFQLYTEAGRLGDLDALTCAGILLEEGLVDPGTDYDDLVSDLALTGSVSPAERNSQDRTSSDRIITVPLSLGTCTESGSLHCTPSVESQRRNNPPRTSFYSAPASRSSSLKRASMVASSTNDRLKAARRYYEVAARQGHADALFRLGKMTEGGQGAIPADPVHAGKLYAEAAKLGHAEAQVAVGYACEQGQSGRMQDYEQAIFWYTKAAEQALRKTTNRH